MSILIVRLLGPRDYGIYSLCKNMMSYLIIFCGLGLSNSALRHIPELLVKDNHLGVRTYLNKSIGLQLGMGIFFLIVMYFAQPWLSILFHVDFKYYLIVTVFLATATTTKDYLYNLFYAKYNTRILAKTTLINGLTWPTLAVILMLVGLKAGGVLLSELFSIFIVLWTLSRIIHKTHPRPQTLDQPPMSGIGKQRVAILSLTFMANALLSLLLSQQTQTFIIGYFEGPIQVGFYNAGSYLPQMALSFIPQAIYGIFTAGFVESFVRQSSELKPMVMAFYKGLILGILPLAVFGIAFGDSMMTILYGSKMSGAGWIMQSFFFLSILPFISMPLSMAITATEKNYRMLPYLVLQVVLNLSLSWILIKHFSILGALIAVFLTFFLTIPFRLLEVKKILGGIYFPGRFFGKILLSTMVVLLLLPLKAYIRQAWSLGLIAATYASLIIIVIRQFSFFTQEDISILSNRSHPIYRFILKCLVKHNNSDVPSA